MSGPLFAEQPPRKPEIVVIGGSAGALEPLCELVAGLPRETGFPIAIVLHIPRSRPSRLAEVIGNKLRRPVVEPQDKEPLDPSMVYVAPADYHLLVDAGPCFALSVDEPVHFSQPAIDVLFESAADVFGARVAGVLLSGANADGARGLSAIARAGGDVMVQDPETAVSPVMPAAALELTPTAAALAVASIRHRLRGISEGRG